MCLSKPRVEGVVEATHIGNGDEQVIESGHDGRTMGSQVFFF